MPSWNAGHNCNVFPVNTSSRKTAVLCIMGNALPRLLIIKQLYLLKTLNWGRLIIFSMLKTRLTSLYNQNYCHTLILLAKKQILFFVNVLRHSTI